MNHESTDEPGNEPIDLSRYGDPDAPPRGYRALPCPDCSNDGFKPSHGASKLAMASGGQIVSLCGTCGSRRWVWWRLADLPPSMRT
jgi:hypothetical protein